MEARPKIGLFAAIFDEEGKLLVKRRPEGISLAGEWDLPGGAVEAENNAKAENELIIAAELIREIEEETGLILSGDQVGRMPAMYPAVIKGGDDWAFVIPIWGIGGEPTKGEFRYVSPEELKSLANGPPGNRLVSGWGKRMTRLALIAFLRHGTNAKFREQARQYLVKIL